MPIVDAHPHIYSPDRDSYPTIAEPWEPGEPASAEDLKKMMDVVGVDRAVFIQTSTFYGHDNRYVMDSAKQHADWACGVVTLDPEDPSHLDLLEEAVKNSNIRGMRGTTDSINRISSPGVYRLWTKAMELGIPVNCMVMDDLDRVPEIERIAQDLGDLKIVIDHCFMLNTRHRTEETLQALALLARLPNVYAKLTPGTHGSYRVYPFVDMHDPLKRVIEAFGPDRCVWGSNFPNALWSRGASYAQNLRLFVKELGLSLPEKADILGGTAMSLWFPREHERETRIAAERLARTERESTEALEDGAGSPGEDEDNSEQATRSARVTMMADLINAQRGAPVLDEAETAELSAILKVASELNAMLGVADSVSRPAADEAAPPAEKEDEDGPLDTPEPVEDTGPKIRPWDGVLEAEETVTVNVEELMASQNYTPIKTDEIGKIDELDKQDGAGADTASDVARQLKTAMESVDVEPGFQLPDLEMAGDADTDVQVEQDAPEVAEETEAEPRSDIAREIDELVATRRAAAAGKDEVEEPEAEPTANVEEPVSAGTDSPVSEPEGETADDFAVDVDELLAEQEFSLPGADAGGEDELAEEPVIDVEALLAAQAVPQAAAPEPEEEPVIDVDALLATQAAPQAAAPEPEEEPVIDVEALLAAQAAPQTSAPESAEEPGIDVEALLAAQDASQSSADDPTAQPHSEKSTDERAPGPELSEPDVSGILDLAQKLNDMLESVEEIGSDIADLAAEDEAS